MTWPQVPDPGAGSRGVPHRYPGWPAYRPPRPTNGWAIAAFVLALFLCVPLGVIFSIVALVQTRDRRERGRGLAIAAIVISGVWVLAGVVGIYLMDHPASHLVLGTTQSGENLNVGQCVNETPQGSVPGTEVGDIESVGCDQPHSDEVFAILSLSYFPDSDADDDEMLANCKTELQEYSTSAGRDPNVQIVLSTPGTNWKYLDDHTAACLAHFASNRVGSVKG